MPQTKEGAAKAAATRRLNRERAQNPPVPEELAQPEVKAKLEETLTPKPDNKEVAAVAENLGQLLTVVTLLGAYLLQQKALMMTPQEAKAFAVPLANIFCGTLLYRRYGRALASSNDYWALLWASFNYGKRVLAQWERGNHAYQFSGDPSPPGGTGSDTGATRSPKQPAEPEPYTYKAADGTTRNIRPVIIGRPDF